MLIAFFERFNKNAHFFKGPKDKVRKNFRKVESDE